MAIVTLCAGGCAVGPDYRRPPLSEAKAYTPKAYTRMPIASTPAGAGDVQHFDSDAKVPAQWWQAFGSPEINELVEHAFQRSPTLDAAKAALRQAQENRAAQYAGYFPTLQADYSASRQREAVSTISPTLDSGDALYTLHTAQLSVSYTPDVFGLNRRAVESLAAQEAAQRFELDAAYTTLAANIVSTAIELASLEAQLRAMQAASVAAHDASTLVQQQLAAGAVSGLDVAAQDTAAAQADAAIPPLEKQLEQTRNLLATLIGEPPDTINIHIDIDSLKLPMHLPLSLPSTLIETRPDVRAAEAQVQAASAEVGVAIANRLPQFTITAAYGGTSTQFSKMFTDGNIFWNLLGGLTQPIFDFGALKHRQGAAEAALEQAIAQYRQTVLSAFQNVADSLYALDADAKGLQASERAEAAAKKTRDLAQIQLDAGAINRLTLLGTEQVYQEAKLARIQAQASRFTDTAALYQSLGGALD
ncbi:efflux transporter outer membrane subunit [Azonexus sp.]|uniref:efflux transporter outer membrane subunit n=1 Tax=Azonexus sp. TaxID=1872668 RepID=UPI0028321AE7|nr:efflux transporter outer membrane subunit [Azonexus sp.]MDR1994807.1 efflux transporter outer membrane subunit [Azonexus sp.]